MLSAECKGCAYVRWAVGIGQGIRCAHPRNRLEDTSTIPTISEIAECELYTAREAIPNDEAVRGEE